MLDLFTLFLVNFYFSNWKQEIFPIIKWSRRWFFSEFVSNFSRRAWSLFCQCSIEQSNYESRSKAWKEDAHWCQLKIDAELITNEVLMLTWKESNKPIQKAINEPEKDFYWYIARWSRTVFFFRYWQFVFQTVISMVKRCSVDFFRENGQRAS